MLWSTYPLPLNKENKIEFFQKTLQWSYSTQKSAFHMPYHLLQGLIFFPPLLKVGMAEASTAEYSVTCSEDFDPLGVPAVTPVSMAHTGRVRNANMEI